MPGIGGLGGALLTGVFSDKRLNATGADGLVYGGGFRQLGLQALACVASAVYAAAITFVLLRVIDKTMGLRVTATDEREGLDATQHGEDAYAG